MNFEFLKLLSIIFLPFLPFLRILSFWISFIYFILFYFIFCFAKIFESHIKDYWLKKFLMRILTYIKSSLLILFFSFSFIYSEHDLFILLMFVEKKYKKSTVLDQKNRQLT